MANELEIECRTELNGVVQKVNKLLVFRNFDDVLQICEEAITKAENYERLADRSEKSSEHIAIFERIKCFTSGLVESLCIIAVQAFAETDHHKDVLPFLKLHYHGVRHFPVKIIQLCILMYGHVEDFNTAEGVFREWKKFPRNQTLPSYPGILELYILNILLPQMKWTEAVKLADEDTVINTERKIALIRFVKKFEQEVKEESQKEQEEIIQKETKQVPDIFSNSVKKIGQIIFKYIPFVNFTIIKNLSLVAVFIYLILFKTNLDTVSGLAYASQLWKGVVRLWNSMFAPYHMAAAAQKTGH